jgi:photosystem II stability/assembly factor-like uncharacterized protein
VCLAQTQTYNSIKKQPESKPDQEEQRAQGMQYRPIGPFRGGRSLTAVGLSGDPTTYYFGGTGGGVWKSTDGAITWKPIFDHEKSSSIGSLAVAPSDANVIYVGTGEACVRGDSAQGDGVYKSVDAGMTWENVGLRDTRAIGKVIIHPKTPDIVFVAGLGHPYGPNQERGIFRTLDGGKNWSRVLYVDENTGGIDVTFDPNNPNILFAAMWQVRREPWTLTSGGPGSGLYRSGDGGATWKRLGGEGFPEGPYGKIGVAVASNSDRVWALIEAGDGGLYRSDDGGRNWQFIDGDHRFTQRAFYYMHIVADPKDPNTVYILDENILRSTDGGHTFNVMKMSDPSGDDNHGLWIDPLNTKRMIRADDEGATVTLDGGKNWTAQDNQPIGQFYHVITDNRFPYHVYGGQQDAGSVAVASRSLEKSVIDPQDWYDVRGGESGNVAPDPLDPNIVYGGSHQGKVVRYDKRTGQLKEISVYPVVSDGKGVANLEHRFNWTAPLLISPHDPKVLYHAGERLFRTTDGGMHWEAISPDLTRNDKSKQIPSGGSITIDELGTDVYDTIFTVAESPLQKGLIWVGTDDGLIHITRDGGKSWVNVTPKDLPEWSKISLIDASPHDAGTAWVAVDRHANDDLRPYIYGTFDYGKTWTKLVAGIPENAFVRVVREDPKQKGLLFAGTEAGIFLSRNSGAAWESLQLNLPMTPVHDLVIHENDLVVATHGRSFWILDDISPLRQWSEQAQEANFWLYQPASAYRLRAPASPEVATTAGLNPPPGAIIYFAAKERPKNASLEILDSSGKVVRRYSSTEDEETDWGPPDPEDAKPRKQLQVRPGLNRFIWDLRYDPAPRVRGYYLYEYGGGAQGPMVLPGRYKVLVTVDGTMLSASLEVKPDPRSNVAQADLEKQFSLLMNIHHELALVYNVANQMIDLREQVVKLQRRVNSRSSPQFLAGSRALDEKLRTMQNKLVNTKIKSNVDSLNYGLGVDGSLANLAMVVGGGSDTAPTAASITQFEKVKAEVDQYLQSWSELLASDVPALQRAAQSLNLGALIVSR